MNPCYEFILRLVLLTGYLSLNYLNADTVRVVGSNFAGEALGIDANSEEKMGAHSVHYHMTGSLIGVIKLQENLADIAFVVQTAKNPTWVLGSLFCRSGREPA